VKCPRCQKQIPTEASSCPACGFSFDDATQRIEKSPSDRSADKRSDSQSFGSIDDSRFVPGTILAERYRIVGLLGKGGMGEVYRADDLKLAQPVALKFLPDHLLSDGAALARFHREVRVARQVSHKNVCRVYDIGEVDGRHFLSMEFIKGEELSSLIRRIGRLPQDKAIQIARQICAGLAAAHEVGVLHRDLKPSNVMIDEHGNARITDFGLAGLAEEFREDEKHAGTPAYMAPEQLEGQTFTVRSEIYSLGLVLYELFTGKRAFLAPTLGDLVKLRRSDTSPTTPSEIVKDLDPAIERVIDRCLQKSPAQRPSSALQVAAALPGGDPIAAALAAGETPSPEMVAAAPKAGVLRPSVAVALLACVVVGVAVMVLFSNRTHLHRSVPLPHSPVALEMRAQETMRRLGYQAAPADSAHGFLVDYDYLRSLHRRDPSPHRWEKLKTGQPAAISFWRRTSPRYMEPSAGWRIDVADPPHDVSGMIRLGLDTLGRLIYFEAVPPQVDPAAESAPAAPDWSAAFREAGFDLSKFQLTTSQWTPPHGYDVRAAWHGTYPDAPDIPIRIEAAGYRGSLVYFEIVAPWRRPAQQVPIQLSFAERMGTPLLLSFYFGALIVGSLLAWQNLRLGRGDRKGALRLAFFIFTLRVIYWAFYAHHVNAFGEVANLLSGLQTAVFEGCFVGVMYLALEPFLRRRWPERIISWNRLLTGQIRDPLVGRDVLIGAAFGAGILALFTLQELLPFWFGGPSSPMPSTSPLLHTFGLVGWDGFMVLMLAAIRSSLLFGLIVVFIVLFFSMLLRRNWLGITVAWLLFAGFFLVRSIDLGIAGALFTLVAPTIIVLVVVRFGLLAFMVVMLFPHLRNFFPVTTDISVWYAGNFIVALILLLGLAVWAFYTSLGGQKVLSGKLLQE
jgi:hypothetical protein